MRSRLSALPAVGVASLALGASVIYFRRPRERIVGVEALDDDAVAVAFDQVAGWPQMRLLRWYLTRRAAAMVHSGAAADLGCGPGRLALELAARSPRLHVTGVDLSEEMLATARSHAARSDVASRVAFRSGDAARLPFRDASLDLIVSCLSLHHWLEPIAVLNEVHRVLRRGGAYLIFDLRRDLAPPSYVLLWFATRVVVPRALRLANEPLASRNAAYTPAEAAALAALSDLRGWRVTQGPVWLTIESVC